MSKTSEALREEIAQMHSDTIGLIGYTTADKIINRILDAFVESMLEYNGRDSKMNYLQVVNKLRPNK